MNPRDPTQKRRPAASPSKIYCPFTRLINIWGFILPVRGSWVLPMEGGYGIRGMKSTHLNNHIINYSRKHQKIWHYDATKDKHWAKLGNRRKRQLWVGSDNTNRLVRQGKSFNYSIHTVSTTRGRLVSFFFGKKTITILDNYLSWKVAKLFVK